MGLKGVGEGARHDQTGTLESQEEGPGEQVSLGVDPGSWLQCTLEARGGPG